MTGAVASVTFRMIGCWKSFDATIESQRWGLIHRRTSRWSRRRPPRFLPSDAVSVAAAAQLVRSAKRRSKTMANLEKALDRVREICLSLPDTYEGDHFGETAFYVRGKLFATCGAKHGVCEMKFGLEPDHAASLLENDPRFKPYSRDKRGVVLDAAKVKSWGEVKELILESYELVKPSKVKKAAKKPTPGKRTRR